MIIPIEQISVLERGRKDLGDLGSLAESIKSNGQITPGVVRPAIEEDGVSTPWVLVAGERRFRACNLAGIPVYKAENFGEMSEIDQQVIELEENLHRKDLTWDEQATMRKKIHLLYKQRAAERGESWGLVETSKATGESIATISRDIVVADALEQDPGLKQAGSKKSAVRIIEMRDHLARKELSAGKIPLGKLQSLMVEADARDWLRRQKTGAFDLFLSDFPYGIDFYSSGQKTTGEETSTSDYDDSEGVTLDLFVDVVPEVIRTTKEVGWIAIFMCDSNYDYLRQLFESCCTKHFDYADVWWEQAANGEWVWQRKSHCIAGEKGDCEFLHAEVPGWIWYRPNSRNPGRLPERHAKNFYERILVLNRGSGRLYKHQDECPNVLVYEAEYGNERIHAMQKPRAIARELVQRFTIPGDQVADCFFGSGNLLAGAAELQRGIQGCEKTHLMIDLAIGNVGEYYS